MSPAGDDVARAAALLAAGQAAKAREVALRRLAVAPDDLNAHLVAASASLRLDDPRAAAFHSSTVIAGDPTHARALRLFGSAALQLGDLPNAASAAAESLRIEPGNWSSHVLIALVETRVRSKGAFERARQAALYAVHLAPDVADTHSVLGEVYLSFRRPGLAEQALRVALSIDPQDVIARQNLGVALERQGRSAAAMQEFADLARSEPADPVHSTNLARAFARGIRMWHMIVLAWASVVSLGVFGWILSYPAEPGPRVIVGIVVLALVVPALVSALVFRGRYRRRLGALLSAVKREEPISFAIAVLLALAVPFLVIAPLMPRTLPAAFAAVAVLLLVITLPLALIRGVLGLTGRS